MSDGGAQNLDDFGKLLFAAEALGRTFSTRETQILRRVAKTRKADAELFGRLRTWLRGQHLDVYALLDEYYDVDHLKTLEWAWGVPPELHAKPRKPVALPQKKAVPPKNPASYQNSPYVRGVGGNKHTSAGEDEKPSGGAVIPTLGLCISKVQDLEKEVGELRDFCFKIVAQNRSLKKMIEDLNPPEKTKPKRRTKK